MGGTNPAAKAAAFSVHYVEQRAGLCITGSCWILGGEGGKKEKKKECTRKTQPHNRGDGKIRVRWEDSQGG